VEDLGVDDGIILKVS